MAAGAGRIRTEGDGDADQLKAVMVALSRQNWPVDPSGKDAFYGRPQSASDHVWQAANLVPYTVPWSGKSVLVHRLVRDSLDRVLTEYWNEIGRDQSVIGKYGLADVETYNYRANRNNPSVLSNHSYGIAVDLAPGLNPNGSTWHDGGTMLPRRIIELAKFEGWRWGGNFGGTKDPMHIEAVFDQHHDQPPVPAPVSITPTVPSVVMTSLPAQPSVTVTPAPLVALAEAAATLVARQLISASPEAAQAAASLRAQAVIGREIADLVIALLDKVAPVAQPSTPITLPPAVGLPPLQLPTPAPVPANVQRGIIATVFGGSRDRETSAYDGHIITDREPGCALPYRFSEPRPLVTITGPKGTVTAPIIDVGPIYPSQRGPADPYWQTNSRPRAETNHVLSQAGIDLTPQTAADVGIDGKGKVDWQFASPPPQGDAQMSTMQGAPVQIPSASPTQNPQVGVPLGTVAGSKINVTQAVAILAQVAAVWIGQKMGLDAMTQGALAVVIQVAISSLTVVLRTWYTTKILPQSLSLPVRNQVGV